MKKSVLIVISIILGIALVFALAFSIFALCENHRQLVRITQKIEALQKQTQDSMGKEEEVQPPDYKWRYMESRYTFEKIPWVEAYREYIFGCMDESGFSAEATFGLCYIDDDDIPELVISEERGHLQQAYIVSYRDSQIVISNHVGSYGCFAYEERTGIVYDNFTGMGNSYTTFYQYKDGELQKSWECSYRETPIDKSNPSDGYVGKYYILDAEVSEEEYLTAMQQHFPENPLAIGEFGLEGKRAVYHDWFMHTLDMQTVNYFFDAISADKEVVGSVLAGKELTVTGKLQEKKYYINYSGWWDTQYAYMLKLDEPLPIYYENEFYFLTEIQILQNDSLRELLNTHLTITGSARTMQNDYHHSPFVIQPIEWTNSQHVY